MEAMATVLEQGSLMRATAATGMNKKSSRSHAIFTITLEQRRPARSHTCALPSSVRVLQRAVAHDSSSTCRSSMCCDKLACINDVVKDVARSSATLPCVQAAAEPQDDASDGDGDEIDTGEPAQVMHWTACTTTPSVTLLCSAAHPS
jgi:hypothetical protein